MGNREPQPANVAEKVRGQYAICIEIDGLSSFIRFTDDFRQERYLMSRCLWLAADC